MAAAGAIAAASVAAAGYGVWRNVRPSQPTAIASSPPISHPRRSPPAQNPATASTVPTGPAADAPPAFDIVRVEPSGETVVAGRAAAGAKVTLFDNGAPLSSAKADASGQFVMTPPGLTVGDHQLSLVAAAGGRDSRSRQSVTVAVPKDKGGRLVVALAAPGQATQILSDRRGGAVRAAPAGEVFIHTVDATQDGRLFVSGAAHPGAPVRVYLNDNPIGAAATDAAGAWSLQIPKTLRPGTYSVRADELAASGAVLGRAETPFEFSGFMAMNRTGSATEPGRPGTVRVERGDNLWRISRQLFGQGTRYTLIFEANSKQIRDRNLIYPGQIFVVPKS